MPLTFHEHVIGPTTVREEAMDDETRAIARLPHLEIEIRYRRLPEKEAEHLAISMKATLRWRGLSSSSSGSRHGRRFGCSHGCCGGR